MYETARTDTFVLLDAHSTEPMGPQEPRLGWLDHAGATSDGIDVYIVRAPGISDTYVMIAKGAPKACEGAEVVAAGTLKNEDPVTIVTFGKHALIERNVNGTRRLGIWIHGRETLFNNDEAVLIALGLHAPKTRGRNTIRPPAADGRFVAALQTNGLIDPEDGD